MGVVIGGAIYEMLVINPLWSGSPPASVRNWNPNPQYAINPGEFWGKAMPVYTLTPIAALIAGWHLRERRKWLMIAVLCALFVIAVSLAYFIPVIIELLAKRGEGLSDAQITSKAHLWMTLSWARVGVLILGWLAALRALSIPPAQGVSEKVKTNQA
jgi:hypothetical protein